MPDQVLIVVAVALFVVVGLMAKSTNAGSFEVFSARRNKLSWFVTGAGVTMSFIGGAALLNTASLGYSYKWYTLVDPAAFFIGIIIAITLVKFYRNDQGITISQLLSGSNKKLSLYIGIVSSVIFVLIIAAQCVAFSKLLAPYFPGVAPILLMVVPSGLILLYVFIGGFSAVTKTDVLQLFFLLAFLIIPVAYYFFSNSSASLPKQEAPASFAPMPFELMIYFCIYGFFIPVSQDINIRVKSARNSNHARFGLLAGSLFYCLLITACCYIGITLAEHGVMVDDPEQTFSTFFKAFYPTFGILPILAGIAAIWSTLDTNLVNAITSVARDLLKTSNHLKNLEDRKLIIIAGLIIFFISITISLLFTQVLALILTALLIYISVLVPVALGKKIRLNESIILSISLISVVVIVLVEAFNIDIYPKPLIYPVGCSLLMCIGRLYQNFGRKNRDTSY